MKIYGDDSSSEGLQTIDPATGKVSHFFKGHVDLEASLTDPPTPGSQLRWIKQSDGSVVARIYGAEISGDRFTRVETVQSNFGDFASSALRARHDASIIKDAIVSSKSDETTQSVSVFVGEPLFGTGKTILQNPGNSHYLFDGPGLRLDGTLRGATGIWNNVGTFADLWFRFYGMGLAAVHYNNAGTDISFGNDGVVNFNVNGTFLVIPWWHFENAGACGGGALLNSASIPSSSFTAGGYQTTNNNDGWWKTIHATFLWNFTAGQHIRMGWWNGGGGNTQLGCAVTRIPV